MSYKFKVGDKGVTRHGRDYEIQYINSNLEKYHQLYAKIDGFIGLKAYSLDGECPMGDRVLLPPKRKVWVALYTTPNGKINSASREDRAEFDDLCSYRRSTGCIVHSIHHLDLGENT